MFTEIEKQYVDSRFENVMDKLDNIIKLQEKANGKLGKHDDQIHEILQDIATSRGHWKGVVMMSTLIGFAVGIIAVYLWH